MNHGEAREVMTELASLTELFKEECFHDLVIERHRVLLSLIHPAQIAPRYWNYGTGTRGTVNTLRNIRTIYDSSIYSKGHPRP